MMPVNRRTLLASMAGGLSTLATTAQSAADMSIVVPYPPGGGAFSLTARMLADSISASGTLHATLDYRPGASGTIGMTFLAHAKPDGLTVGIGSVSTLAVLPAVKAPMVHYDPSESFAPIAFLAEAPVVLAVAMSLGISSFEELLDIARRKPGALNFASMGEFGISHILMQLIESRTGLDAVNVPYQSSAAVLSDVVGGRIQLMLDQSAALQPLLLMKAIRPLVVLAAKRLTAFPGVPAAHEVGLAGLESTVWSGLLAPAQTDEHVLGDMHRRAQDFLALRDTKRRLSDMGFTPQPASRDFFSHLIKRELAQWTARAHDLKLRKN